MNFVVGGALLAVASSRVVANTALRAPGSIAALPLVAAGLLTAYVFGEDTYRDNGTSRWDAYRSPGGALGWMFVLSVALMVACAALLARGGLRHDERLVRAAALAAALAVLLLLTPTIVGFSSN